MSLKTRARATARAFREALVCLALGLRDSLHPGMLLRSSGLCLLVFLLWSWLFYQHFELIAVGAGLLSLFVTYGGLLLGFIPQSGGSAGIAGMGGIAQGLASLLLITAVMTVALLVILYSGAIVLSIRLALRWVLLGRARQRALRHYPQLHARELPPGDLLRSARYRLGPWLGMSLGTLLCLLVPLLNGVLLLMLLAYLNVRFLTPAALRGLSPSTEQLTVIASRRSAMTAFGLLILLLALIPVINLLLPALLATGTCHLCYRALGAVEAPTGMAPMPQVSLPAS